MISRADVAGHLESSARVGFLTARKKYQPLRSLFVKEAPSDGAFEVYVDLGAPPWPVDGSGQPAGSGTDARTGHPQVGGLHEGGPITIVGAAERGLVLYNKDWPLAIGVYHNAINDNRVGGLEDWAQGIGIRYEQHKDWLCFAALNGGDGSTYGTCYDGLSFFNDSHKDPGAEYQTTQDNKYALTLSIDNFETVYVAGGGFLDSRGQPCGMNHLLLIHSINLKRMAKQITDNKEGYDTANREMNPYAGDVKSLQAPGGYVDSTFWALVDPIAINKPIILQVREEPRLQIWDDYTQTPAGIRYYAFNARYVTGYGDWRTAIMGNS